MKIVVGQKKNKRSQHFKITNQKGGIEGGKRQKKERSSPQ
jgi:hypothetical protein